MKTSRLVLAVLGLGFALAVVGAAMVLRRGLSARDQPTQVEVLVARQLRHWAVPLASRREENPVDA